MRRFHSANVCLFFAIVFLTVVYTYSQTLPQTQDPISTILNDDGSVKTNLTGSFDTSGYSLVYGKNGEPRFVTKGAVVPGGCSDSWDTSFSLNGATDSIRAIVSDGAGNIYVGGPFRVLNTVVANGIAKWDGTSWTALSSGLNGRVDAIAVSGNDVYAAGSFTTAGGVAVNNVAKWDGSSWSALGPGIGGGIVHGVLAIAVSGSHVYVGGDFNSTGGFPNFVAQWDGTSWTSMGTGMNNSVYALAVSGGTLYAGGSFTTAGGVAAGGIAKWDGTAWTSVGTGVNSRVRAIAFSGTDLYVGGVFNMAGGNPAISIAKWNGSTWSALGSGVGPGEVRSLAVSGSDVYAGGVFTTAGGLSANRIAKWNGSAWSQLGTGVDGQPTNGTVTVYGIAVLGNTVFAGGEFGTAGSINAEKIAKWSDGIWSAFQGTSVNNVVRVVAVSGTDIYVGGTFNFAGSVPAVHVAKWDGTTWSALGSGISGLVTAMAVSGNDVYVGGTFSNAGGISARNIAKWNGTNWSQLGSGVNSSVFAITVLNSDIYVGGAFTTAGNLPANHIAKWDGASWTDLDSAIVNTVTAIVPSGDFLYVGTDTTTVDSPNYFLKYDGTTWTPLGQGMTGGGVSSIAVSGTDVYVAGLFTAVGGVPAARIAKYDGSSWSALGSGLPGNSNIVRLMTTGSDLYAVGDFSVANQGPADRTAKWNGNTWEPLGSGLGGNFFGSSGLALAASGDSVYVGGFFTTAGCNLSPYFARWQETLWTGAASTDWHTGANWGSGSVPSSNNGVTIQANDASITTSDVTVSSLIVEGGHTVTIGAGRTLTVTGNLDLSDGNLAGAGILVVNGNLNMNSASITGLGSIFVSRSMFLNGGSISSVGPITTNGNLTITNGNITGTGSITTNGNLSLNAGNVTGAGTITTNGNLSLNGGDISGFNTIVINGNLLLNGGTISGAASVAVNTCSANAVSGGSSNSFVAGPLTRCVNASGIYRFPVGTGTVYSPVELSNIVGGSNFTAEAKSGAYPGAATGLPVNRLGRWWDLTNGGITKADINFFYPDAEVVGIERRYSAYRIDGGTATRLPTDIDETANRAYVPGVTAFSPWTLAESDPSVLTMTGRVTTNSGRGAESVLVSITDDQGMTRYAVTNPFGYFRFFNITTFRFYTVRVTPKKFKFLIPQRIVDFDELTGDVTFVSRDH